MNSTLVAVTGLVIALTTLVATVTHLWVTMHSIHPMVSDTQEKMTVVANGQAARVDQLEQAVQAAGAPVPPVPTHPAETGSEPI